VQPASSLVPTEIQISNVHVIYSFAVLIEALVTVLLPPGFQAISNHGQAKREGYAAEQRHEAEKHFIILCCKAQG
jgi:hypothetical protein